VKCEIEKCEKNENKNNGKEFFLKKLITNLGAILSNFQQGLAKIDPCAYVPTGYYM
jgi:hypothetical protein